MTEIKINRFVLSWQKRTTKEVLTLKLGTETKVKRLENCKNLLWKACKIRVIRIHLIGFRGNSYTFHTGVGFFRDCCWAAIQPAGRKSVSQ